MPVKHDLKTPRERTTEAIKRPGRFQNPNKIEFADNYLRGYNPGYATRDSSMLNENNARKSGLANYVDTVTKRKLNKVQKDLRRREK